MAVLLLWQRIYLINDAANLSFSLPTWLGIAESLFSFFALLVVCRRTLARWAHWLPVVLCLLIFGNYVAANLADQAQSPGPRTDIYVFSDYAAQLVRLGQNPYQHDLYEGYHAYRIIPTFTTPLQNDSLSGTEVYPPLMFLSLLPFQWLGLPSAYAYGFFTLLTLAVIYVATPRIFRPIVLLPFFAGEGFLTIPLSGAGESVWLFFIALLIARWSRSRERGLWYGLACAVKQNVWLLAPFLLIRVWRSDGRREALRFALLSGGVFLLINLPFIVAGPGEWFSAILRPFWEPQIYLSVGLSRLTEYGLVLLSKDAYLVLVGGVLAIALVLYGRRGGRWTAAIWLVPGIAAWFSYRALLHYWVFLALPVLLDLLTTERAAEPVVEAPRSRRVSLEVLLIGGFAAALGAALLVYAAAPAAVEAHIHWPVTTVNNRVQDLSLTVTNHSSETMQPRFLVQGDFYHQTVFWHIRRGPIELAPGESGDYDLTGTWPVWSMPYYTGNQIIVADDDNYDLRAFAGLPQDNTVNYPDLPKNIDYRYWRDDQNAPTNWSRLAQPASQPDITWRSASSPGPATCA